MQSTKSDYNSIGSPNESIDQFNVNDKAAKSIVKSKTKRQQKAESNENEHQQENDNLNESHTQSLTDSDDESTNLEADTTSNNYRQNWWKQSETKYAFNLPIVRENLGRLVGTDEVTLNDHQFMMNLRTSVWNDFDEKLIDRVKQREAKEIERAKKLILKSEYRQYNCPKNFVPLHSQVLVLDLHDEQVKSDTSDQLNRYAGPVFNINQKTNATIDSRRRKITTIRKRNYENLMRHVLRDFKLSEKSEYDETRAIQNQIKSIKKKHFSFIAKMIMKVKSMIKCKQTPQQK